MQQDDRVPSSRLCATQPTDDGFGCFQSEPSSNRRLVARHLPPPVLVISKRTKDMSKRRDDYQRYLKSGAWQAKRRCAFDAYGRKCNRCGTTTGSFQVHHKRYGRNLDEISVKWLEVLCRPCHEKHHKEAADARRRNRKPRRTSRLVALILDVDATD